ncbi:MAG: pitrilysin family protein [Pseudomonadota bacterium]
MTFHSSAIGLTPASASQKVSFAPSASQFALANGMQVVVIPDRRAPVVTHMVWYKVGSADEAPGQTGIAHFLEHLMFKGTSNYPEDTFSETISRLGGTQNAFTSYDYTAYFQRISVHHLPLMMTMEADRMQNLVLNDEVVTSERNVVLEERASRIDNDPSAQMRETYAATFYQNHPYRAPIIGWKHEIEGLDRQTALDFYGRYYTPENAILVVAGDVDEDAVRAIAEETYGKIPPRQGAVTSRSRPKEPEPVAERRVELRDERIGQPIVQVGFLAPSYTHTDTEFAPPALDILAYYLGDGPTSVLYKELVVKRKVAASIGMFYNGNALDHGALYVYAYPAQEADLAELEGQIMAALQQFLDTGISEEDLARAKRNLVAQMVFAQDSQSSLARIFGASLAVGEDLSDVQQWPSRIHGVTVDHVMDAAKAVIQPKRAVVGVQQPADMPVN